MVLLLQPEPTVIEVMGTVTSFAAVVIQPNTCILTIKNDIPFQARSGFESFLLT
jgi:hypothetical protein